MNNDDPNEWKWIYPGELPYLIVAWVALGILFLKMTGLDVSIANYFGLY